MKQIYLQLILEKHTVT